MATHLGMHAGNLDRRHLTYPIQFDIPGGPITRPVNVAGTLTFFSHSLDSVVVSVREERGEADWTLRPNHPVTITFAEVQP